MERSNRLNKPLQGNNDLRSLLNPFFTASTRSSNTTIFPS